MLKNNRFILIPAFLFAVLPNIFSENFLAPPSGSEFYVIDDLSLQKGYGAFLKFIYSFSPFSDNTLVILAIKESVEKELWNVINKAKQSPDDFKVLKEYLEAFEAINISRPFKVAELTTIHYIGMAMIRYMFSCIPSYKEQISFMKSCVLNTQRADRIEQIMNLCGLSKREFKGKSVWITHDLFQAEITDGKHTIWHVKVMSAQVDRLFAELRGLSGMYESPLVLTGEGPSTTIGIVILPYAEKNIILSIPTVRPYMQAVQVTRETIQSM